VINEYHSFPKHLEKQAAIHLPHIPLISQVSIHGATDLSAAKTYANSERLPDKPHRCQQHLVP